MPPNTVATTPAPAPLDIAVIGSGISGLAAAWLLAQRHRVTLYEADARLGGHSHTVDVPTADGGALAVDTGFIVYNEPAYPNLTALFAHLGVATRASDMSFAVSLDGGRLEYSGSDLAGLFAQRGNLLSPRFWSMLRDLLRFYRQAPLEAPDVGLMSLDDYLDRRGYGRAFRDDHLYPMAAAIWSAPAAEIGRYPTQAFVRFCENHDLLKVGRRSTWRTVVGGSRAYVQRLAAALGEGVQAGRAAVAVLRDTQGVKILTTGGEAARRHDEVVIATHADQALRLLPQASADERRLLGAFGYTRNRAVLHGDAALMPQRRAVWSSWNYSADRDAASAPCVTYWMNRLQGLAGPRPIFLTLNPRREPAPGQILHEQVYEHPLFDAAAMLAQEQLWPTLQGRRHTWFCGAYFGAGFHEDGLQAGLAVAEALGGVRRPWSVAGESARIRLGGAAALAAPAALAA
ncbi:MAG: FAD-dependent oxidoreductase [Burkholderiales bacterium]|nr:FAD-dependent oxidoreductase [Burkholderiales bacterium]